MAAAPVVETPVAETAAPAAAPAVEAPVAETAAPEATPAVETPVAETAAPEATPAVETPVAETAAPAAAPAVETPTVPVTEAPINETVNVAGSSNGLDDDAVQTEETPEEIVPFALSPIDEGVTPAAEVVVSQENVPVAATVQAEDSNIIKFSRKSADQVKAILVTSAQHTKLIGSRETQKALVSNKLNAAMQVSDTKKQMEEMLNQANALYQQGKADEAQALYNQVSTMNQSIQTETPNVLVKVA